MKIWLFFFLVFSNFLLNAQVIFQESFNDTSYKTSWSTTTRVEQALWLGKENSNYLRFHPNFQNQSIITPTITATSGNYILFFEWNKAQTQTPDSVQVQLSVNNGTTSETIYTIYDGNNRNWQKDSVELNNISTDFKIRWNYFSSGSFPSQYFNLDNVSIEKAISTSIKTQTNSFDFNVFPNPARDYFQIRLKNPMLKNGLLIIYNPTGEIVYQKNIAPALQTLYQIDVSNFNEGAYIVNVQLGKEQFSKTILVQ
jgi:hypothetical protein